MAQGNETVAQREAVECRYRLATESNGAYPMPGRCGGVRAYRVGRICLLWEDTNGTGQVQCGKAKNDHILCRRNESGII